MGVRLCADVRLRRQCGSARVCYNKDRAVSPARLVRAVRVCVTAETSPLDRLGQLGEFEQDRNTDSEPESNPGSHGAQSKAHVARHVTRTVPVCGVGVCEVAAAALWHGLWPAGARL